MNGVRVTGLPMTKYCDGYHGYEIEFQITSTYFSADFPLFFSLFFSLPVSGPV